MNAQEKFQQWLEEVSTLNISESRRDLLDLIFRYGVALNQITQEAEKEHSERDYQ